MTYVWTKRCLPEEESAWNTKLELLGIDTLVATTLRRQKMVRLEVYSDFSKIPDQLLQLFGGTLTKLKDQNWAALGDQRPIELKIRDRLFITSESDTTKLSRLRKTHSQLRVLSIPPELAFGTGDHATTANCLRLLVDIAKERRGSKWSMLDLGTGTGVLAIAAKALDAHKVEGWENDPLAIDVAKRNVLANGFEAKAIPIRKRDVLTLETNKPTFDVIVANLFSEILIAIFPKIRQVLKPNGTLAISGILDHQTEGVFAAAKNSGFTFSTIKQRGPWIAARTSD